MTIQEQIKAANAILLGVEVLDKYYQDGWDKEIKEGGRLLDHLKSQLPKPPPHKTRETEPSMEEVVLAMKTSWGRGSLDMVDIIGSRKEALNDCEVLLVHLAEDNGDYVRWAMRLLKKHFDERYKNCNERCCRVLACEKGDCVCRGEKKHQTPTP